MSMTVVKLVSWSLLSLFSTNMAISETNSGQLLHRFTRNCI